MTAPALSLKGRQHGRFVYPASRNREEAELAYRIDKGDHDVVDALRRIAAEEVMGAIAAAEREGDIGERIHDIRKRMKKLRGLIRLVRPAFPDYAAENARFRDIGRSISGVRDAEVTAETLGRLLDTHERALAPDAFAGLRAEIAGARHEAPDLAPVIAALRLARGRIDLWTLHETGWDAVAGGLHKVYRGARRGQDAKDDEELHAWRKPIKYHWYQVQLLREISREAMEAREKAADQMGDLLGQQQDLAVLDRRVRRSALPKEARRVLRGLIGQRKSELEAEAREFTPRLFADKPKALVARWGDLWKAWRG